MGIASGIQHTVTKLVYVFSNILCRLCCRNYVQHGSQLNGCVAKKKCRERGENEVVWKEIEELRWDRVGDEELDNLEQAESFGDGRGFFLALPGTQRRWPFCWGSLSPHCWVTTSWVLRVSGVQSITEGAGGHLGRLPW